METSGVLPMCGHGSIGMITFALEHGLVRPAGPASCASRCPQAFWMSTYRQAGNKVTSVNFVNVPSFLYARDVEIVDHEFGPLKVDVSYGGNFYAIIEPQGRHGGLGSPDARQILAASPRLRLLIDQKVAQVHPENPSILCQPCYVVGRVRWRKRKGAAPCSRRERYRPQPLRDGNIGAYRPTRGDRAPARRAGIRAPQLYQFAIHGVDRRTHAGRKICRGKAVAIEGSAYVTGYNQCSGQTSPQPVSPKAFR